MSDKLNPVFTAPTTDEVVYAVLDMLYNLITTIENKHGSQLRRYHNKPHNNEEINNDQPWR